MPARCLQPVPVLSTHGEGYKAGARGRGPQPLHFGGAGRSRPLAGHEGHSARRPAGALRLAGGRKTGRGAEGPRLCQGTGSGRLPWGPAPRRNAGVPQNPVRSPCRLRSAGRPHLPSPRVLVGRGPWPEARAPEADSPCPQFSGLWYEIAFASEAEPPGSPQKPIKMGAVVVEPEGGRLALTTVYDK